MTNLSRDALRRKRHERLRLRISGSSERPRLSEPLTDVLIDEGDRVVINAVAANPGARFSARGFSALVARSSQDELLLAKLRDREDVPERHLPVLFELAKQAARQRIEKDGLVRDSKIVGLVVDEAARSLANEADIRAQAYRAACAEVASTANSDCPTYSTTSVAKIGSSCTTGP